MQRIAEKRKSETRDDSAEDYGTKKLYSKKKSPSSRNGNITINDQSEMKIKMEATTPVQKMK